MQREMEEQGNLNDFLCVYVCVVQHKQIYGLFIHAGMAYGNFLCNLSDSVSLVNFKLCHC